MRELIASYTRKDFRVDTFCAGGPGGQHQNKTQSGIRITHLLSGLSAECREHREQGRNKAEAFRKLGERIKQWHRKQLAQRPERGTETVRTYHEPDNRVKDHASGMQRSWTEVVDKRFLDEMIDARRQ